MNGGNESRSETAAPACRETGESAVADRPRVVVFGWGNVSRGDDGLGPLLLARIEALGLPHVTTIEDFQLQIEHALDLRDADLALFVDASVAAPAAFGFFDGLGPVFGELLDHGGGQKPDFGAERQ